MKTGCKRTLGIRAGTVLEIILPKPLHWTYENLDVQRSQVIPEIQED